MDDWREIAKYLWGILVPAAGWIFHKQDKRITDLEASIYTKNAAAERRAEIDKKLEDRRQDVIALHAKIDDRTDHISGKLDKTSLLLAKIAGKLEID